MNERIAKIRRLIGQLRLSYIEDNSFSIIQQHCHEQTTRGTFVFTINEINCITDIY